MPKQIVIVGCGVSGLSAGIHARLAGYDTVIVDQQTVPGGLVQCWKRGRFMFDGCVHWITGCHGWPSTFAKLYSDLGVNQIKFFTFDEFSRFEPTIPADAPYTPEERSRLEKPIIFASNIPQCLRNLNEAASRPYPGQTPASVAADKALNTWIMGIALRLSKGSLGDPAAPLWKAAAQMICHFGLRNIYTFVRYSSLSMDDLAARYKSPLLQVAFRRQTRASPQNTKKPANQRSPAQAPETGNIWWNIWARQCPAVYFWMILAWMHRHAVGYPVGGSQTFSNRLYERYTSLGGRTMLGKRVTQLLVRDDKFQGIRLLDGTDVCGDYLVWAGDGHTLLFDMLNQRYMDTHLRRLWNETQAVEGCVIVMLGLGQSRINTIESAGMRSNASGSVVELAQPLTIAGTRHHTTLFHVRGPESGLILTGDTASSCIVTLLFGSSYDCWAALASARTEAYPGMPATATTAATTAAAQAETVAPGRPEVAQYPSYAAALAGTPAAASSTIAQGPAVVLPGMGGPAGPHDPHAYARSPAYIAEKQRLAQWGRDFLRARYGDDMGQVEVCEVVTPLSYHRYTSNYRASQNGWIQMPGLGMLQAQKNAYPVPGLAGAFMAGQWVCSVGGVPTTVMSGRDAISMLQLVDHAAAPAPPCPTPSPAPADDAAKTKSA
ncbi:putative phytoene dehydrogenase [Paratrimastix pyriformis]|uniref:Phytoene dehydrogenase n=1 Tax=Paratrimastix pyriformis TaxID=342808 RepID=A0ABQ8UIA1_9EUKA|nr:putative phytoene dehydrogenase [Paratrimastix pyriformis]